MLTWLVLRPGGEMPGGLGDSADLSEGQSGAAGDENVDPLAPMAGAGTDSAPVVPAAPSAGDLSAAVPAGAAPVAELMTVVNDATGAPIAQAGVYLAPSARVQAVGNWALKRLGVTDAAGRIDARRWQVRSRGGNQLIAIVPGLGTSNWVPMPPAGQPGVELRVVAGGELAGTVRDAHTDRPIAGATVQCQLDWGGQWRDSGPPLLTDARGRYRVVALPPGRILRAVVRPSAHAEPSTIITRDTAYPADALAARHAVRLRHAGDRAELDLQALGHDGVRATFVLAVPDGVAMPARVTVTHGFTFRRRHHGKGEARTVSSRGGDERVSMHFEGEFVVTTRERDWEVTLTSGAPTVTIFVPAGDNHVSFYTATLATGRWTRTVVASHGDLQVPRLLRAKRAVWLQLVDATGQPLPRPDVAVAITRYHRAGAGDSEAGQELGSVTTDAQGRAELTSLLRPVGSDAAADQVGFQPAGQGLYRSAHWGSRRDARLLSGAQLAALLQAAAADQPAVITVPALPSRPITFRVVDMRGQPLPGLEVLATPASRFRTASSRSRSDGLVSFDYLGAPEDEGFGEGEPSPALDSLGRTVGADHRNDPVFTLRHASYAGTLTADVVLQHTPLTPAQVRTYGAAQAREAAAMRAAVAGNPDREADLKRRITRQQLQLAEEADTHAWLIAVGSRTITLECVNAEGTPWAGTTLIIDSDTSHETSPEDATAQADAQGLARLRIPLDATWLQVSADDAAGGRLFPVIVGLEVDQDRYRVVFDPERSLELRVRWPAGVDGAAMMRITTLHFRDAATQQLLGSATPEFDGNTGGGVVRLPARRIVLAAQTADGVYRGSAEIDVPAGGQAILDMLRTADLVQVRILVTDPLGRPAAGVVQAFARNAANQTFTWRGPVGADGAFTFPLSPGAYPVLVVQLGEQAAVVRDAAVPAEGPIPMQLGKR